MQDICKKFSFTGDYVSVEAYGDGHINDTYKVTYEYNGPVHYILQRVNHTIFENTEGLMNNIKEVTNYLKDMLMDFDVEGYEALELVKTLSGDSFYKCEAGNYYRAYVFVEDATGHTFIKNNRLLYEAGVAFGEFQVLLKDYPVSTLVETIKDFHHTPRRFRKFITVLEEDRFNLKASCQEAVDFVLKREAMTGLIVEALNNGDIPYRVTHNDTKLNNVLIDDKTGKGRCVIDLDTVMPGSALYDFGDAIRSCGSNVAEDEENLDLMTFEIERFEAFTKGFLSVLKDELTDNEIAMLAHAAIIMTLECGIRFLTDYLEGDVYFKVHKEKHNLIRAKNQFRFVAIMEKELDKMKQIIDSCI